MSHLKDAFLVSAAAARGTSSLSMDRIQFPSLRYDYTLRQFYVDSQVFGSHNESAEYVRNLNIILRNLKNLASKSLCVR
jgi:hypothetical protein